MEERIYLIDLSELSDETMIRGLKYIGENRRKKQEKIKNRKAGAQNVGAGVLLQLALAQKDKAVPRMQVLSMESIIELLEECAWNYEEPVAYGEKGKPYWVNVPLHFNLSHSGDYVLCVISENEVGADLEEIRADRTSMGGIVHRFFSEEEKKCFETISEPMERVQYFYKLWTRKEAFGKLSGEGIFAGKLSENLNDDNSVEWLEAEPPEGYAMSICHKRSAEKEISPESYK